MSCPACNSRKKAQPVDGRANLHRCPACGALFGSMYRGDALAYVALHREMVAEAGDPANLRYFDLTLVGSAGVDRVHGWYDSATRRVVQIG